jgi:hypothetical protein
MTASNAFFICALGNAVCDDDGMKIIAIQKGDPASFYMQKNSRKIACEHSLHTGCTPRMKKVNKIKDFLALYLATGTIEGL